MIYFREARLILTLIICIGLVVGCSSASPKAEELSGHVKIMFSSQDFFDRSYGNLFNSKFPGIHVEVTSTNGSRSSDGIDPNKVLDDYIDREQPDVLVLNQSQFQHLASNGRLEELEIMVAEKDFMQEDILPSVLRRLRGFGEGKLFGLSPTFSGTAIYYNQDLFEQYGVQLPQDKLTWPEMLDISKRFPVNEPNEDSVFGFTWGTNDPYSLALPIGINQGLDFADPNRQKLVLDSPSWTEIFNYTTEAFKLGTIYTTELASKVGLDTSDQLRSDSFIMGKTAMTLGGPELGHLIDRAKKEVNQYESFKWGILSEPIDPSNPSYGTISLNQIYCVRADSPNKDAALELIKFINSDSVAKMDSRIKKGNLQSRTKYNSNKEGISYDPFYTLEIREQSRYITMPIGFNEPFNKLASKELKKVVDGKTSLEDAVNHIQSEGQIILDTVNLKAKVDKDS